MIRNLILGVLLSVLVMSGCSTDSADPTPAVQLTSNENILVKTLIYTEWSSASEIMPMTYSDLRNTLISKMKNRCGNSLSSLQEMRDYDLGWGALMYNFLLDSGAKTAQQLSSMTLNDYRNSIINLNAAKTGSPASEFQAKNNAENLQVAYNWWFSENSSIKLMIDKLNNVRGSNPTFNLKDDKNFGMDVLRIVKADEAYMYLGVYHSTSGTDHFKLYLAGSNDLKTWTNLAELGDRAHQGYIKKWGSGYLVANEQDVVQGSNNVQIRYYLSYAKLIANEPGFSKSISRSFSNYAEGTPDIQVVEGVDPANSHILIGFHYYDNGVRDQVAFGILHNFSEWRAWKDEVSNFNIQEMGYKGNIGARCGFAHNGKFVLQEAQIASGDWSSWRLLFGDGAFYYSLHPETSGGSVSFANPGITMINPDEFAVTSFMPSQGNNVAEKGELMFTFRF
jgi:hypothetical protein